MTTSIVGRDQTVGGEEFGRRGKKLLKEAKELWKGQVPNKIGAAEMIRVDRDAR